MSLVELRGILSKAVSNEPHRCDYEELLPALRDLRNASALQGRDFQLAVISDVEMTSHLVKLVDKMSKVSLPNADSTLAFSIGVQCVVNLMNDNDDVRRVFAEKYQSQLVSWFRCEHPKQQNFVAAALLNIDKVGELDLSDKEFVCSLIKSAQSDVEFSLHLLQNLIKSHHLPKLYEAPENDGKLFLLQVFESAVTGSEEFVEEVGFIISVYKKHCDNLMAKLAEVSPFSARELAMMLEVLASLSCKPVYMASMQKDVALIISSAYLLRGLHECMIQKKTWKESLDDAVRCIKNKEADPSDSPFFGVKGTLIRLLGNLAYRNSRNQDEVREAGCIPIILDSCRLDGENPFIKEWSILTIRNLCEGNSENQKFIKDMKLQGYEVVHELSLTLDGGDGAAVSIAPLKKS